MIERYQLRYFLALVETGNFSRAAAQLNVTQPTLSVGIAKLERMLGSRLFDRNNRRIQLTEAGSRLQAYARRIESDFHLAEREVAGHGEIRRTRLGVVATLPTALVSLIVDQHRASGTGERLEIVEGSARDLAGRLARQAVDLALTVLPETTDELEADCLFSEGYGVALGATHHLAGRAEVRAEDLQGEVMMVRRNCEALSQVSNYFVSRGVRPEFSFRSTNDDRVVAMVISGLGVTVMPDCYRNSGMARAALADLNLRRNIGLAHASGARPERNNATARIVRDAVGRWLPTWQEP